MPRKVIIDADPGIVDALAIIIALFDPRIEVVALTAVAGNVGAELATRNMQTILDQVDPPRIARIGAATEPERSLPQRTHLVGSDGLGNNHFPYAELHQRHAAEKVLFDTVRTAPEQVTLVALGPLTNIAMAVSRDPGWANMVGHLVILGGTVTAPGNITAAAEFNIYCDPLAARSVFLSPTTKTLIPLDVTNQVVLTYDLLDQLPSEASAAGAFLRKTVPFAFRASHQQLGVEGLAVPEAVALAAVVHPELFTFQDLAGDVETAGEVALGATVFDRRRVSDARPNIAVATEVDVSGITDFILRGLATAGNGS
jgi:purine nucleosidase